MRISKLLGATMVAGAIATGGATPDSASKGSSNPGPPPASGASMN
jgi:hypothetical protein